MVAPVAAVPNAEEITDTSCSLYRLAPDTGSVRWRASLVPGSCFTHALTEPAIGDLDRDGRDEVAVATTEDALIVYGAADGRERFRVSLGTYGYGRPTVGNLTPAPGPEVVAPANDGTVAVLDGATGAALAAYSRPVPIWTFASVADLDGDGSQEPLVRYGDGRVAALAYAS